MHATNGSRAKKSLAPSKKARRTSTSEVFQPKLSIMSYARIPETPSSSAYPTEDEDDSIQTKNRPTFPFLSLPSELRNKIYPLVFAAAPPVIDLDPHTFATLHRYKVLALFRVSRQVHREAIHYFFSTHTFRIFPTFPGHYFKTKRPLLARLPAHYRASITSLELRLGPGWNDPPQGWVVNDALGLADCLNVRVLKVFVECDPSDAIFKGFRMTEGGYERFSAGLLDGVLKVVPGIKVVEFDAYSSVKRTGDMMSGLENVAKRFGKILGWVPERGWEKESDQTWLDAVLIHGAGKRLSKSVVIFG
ncbi:Uncharacterized protein BP5553_08786 [Venustampulla echinocandica]|uniref:F-box domain-containing protein n=1 Tax=Venustampulla echinocandica TaxID=2656787 RepID=A0A370TF78_9HELO|nr:Uncharacterized protein BP5553_08786 [Venustampulla echinocandica]RDL33347.1 Uncharacterized protein BP5553_08786 [Venustampulla echinocandica]